VSYLIVWFSSCDRLLSSLLFPPNCLAEILTINGVSVADGVAAVSGWKDTCFRSQSYLKRQMSFNRKSDSADNLNASFLTGRDATTGRNSGIGRPLSRSANVVRESINMPSIEEIMASITIQFSLDKFLDTWREESLFANAKNIVIFVMISRVLSLKFLRSSVDLDQLGVATLEILNQLEDDLSVTEMSRKPPVDPNLRELLQEKCVQLLTDIINERCSASKPYVTGAYDVVVKLISTWKARGNFLFMHSCVSLAIASSMISPSVQRHVYTHLEKFYSILERLGPNLIIGPLLLLCQSAGASSKNICIDFSPRL